MSYDSLYLLGLSFLILFYLIQLMKKLAIVGLKLLQKVLSLISSIFNFISSPGRDFSLSKAKNTIFQSPKHPSTALYQNPEHIQATNTPKFQ